MHEAALADQATTRGAEGSERAARLGALHPRTFNGWLLPLTTLALWEFGSHLGAWPRNWLPAPSEVFGTLVDLSKGGALLEHVLATLLRLGLGFGLGAALGSVFGMATGRSARLRSLLDPSLQALRNIPSLAWVPLFLLWLGIGETSKVVLIAVGVFFPVYLNLMAGILAIDRRLVEVGQLHGLHGWTLARRVLIPATLPAYLTGLRSGLGLGWMFVVAAELMGASRGLGYLLVDGQTTSRPELVIGAIVMFAALGKATDWTIERASTRAQAWRQA